MDAVAQKPVDWFYPTAFDSWGAEEHAAIDRVVASGRFTMGREVEAFEEEFAEFHYRRHCIMVNSGSSANLVATAALFNAGRISGPMAVVPAIAWPTTYAPLVQHNLALKLVDVDDTWNAPTASLDSVVAPGYVGLVVICSLLGNPAYLHDWRALADKWKVPTLEDNCESLWATETRRGWPCAGAGRVGTLSTFSFYWSHQLSAIEGGAILTDDDELARMCRLLRNHGWARGANFGDEYRFEAMGYNVRPQEINAAIARVQLDKVLVGRQARQDNLEYFWDHLPRGAELMLFRQASNGRANPFGIAFEVMNGREARAQLAAALRANGVDCRPVAGGSLSQQPYGRGWAHQPTPRADVLHKHGMVLGCASRDIRPQIDRALEVISRFRWPL